jgi:hypothetical protein
VYQFRPSGRLTGSMQIRVVINDPRSPSKGKFQSVFSVSTFKVTSWGPIALRGAPPGSDAF